MRIKNLDLKIEKLMLKNQTSRKISFSSLFCLEEAMMVNISYYSFITTLMNHLRETKTTIYSFTRKVDKSPESDKNSLGNLPSEVQKVLHSFLAK